MTIPLLKPISDLWKPKDRSASKGRHLILAGIKEQAFVNQWGPPDIRFSLDSLEGSSQQSYTQPDNRSNDGAPLSVWIYSKQDRIFFFTNQKLVSHFKWSAFKEKRSQVQEKADLWTARSTRRSSAVMAYALSSVA
jgi:hypothetical protein